MKIAVIGCGVMGSAFARHFARSNPLVLCDSNYDKAESLAKELKAEAKEDVRDAVKNAELIFLAVKPADLSEMGKALKGKIKKEQLVISILAGTPLSLLRAAFPESSILRMMPNLAIMHGEGAIGLVQDPSINAAWKKKIESLFHGLGLLHWLSEDKIDAFTALVGSGPAFIFVLVDAMIDSGVLLGFSHQEAREFALKTLQGSITLLEETGKTPSELKWQIASPKGTTIAGIKALEHSGFKSAIIGAFEAAYERAKKMHH